MISRHRAIGALIVACLAWGCGSTEPAPSGDGVGVSDVAAKAERNVDWLEGNWVGCEDAFLHEKAMTSSLGGVVIGANKVLLDGVIQLLDYFELRRESERTEKATMTFYTEK